MKDRGKIKNKQQQQKKNKNFWKNQKLFHEGFGNIFFKKINNPRKTREY